MFLDPLRPIAVATKNLDKLRELVALWGDAPPPLIIAADEYPDVEETSSSYEGNAVLKATALALTRDGPALADDSGIEVEGLDWGPGVLSARTPSPSSTPSQRNEHMLEQLRERPGASRRARFVCVCALVVPGHEPVVARGEVEGEIAPQPRGSAGFGYDPVFFYPPYHGTFGEAGVEKKHAVSHRGRAIRALRALLAASP